MNSPASNKDDNLSLALKVRIKSDSDTVEEVEEEEEEEEEESSRDSPYMMLHSTKIFKVKFTQ